MVSIKGPRSALTDFIEEHNIKIDRTKNKDINTEQQTIVNEKVKKKRHAKKIRTNEITNIEKRLKTLEDISLDCIVSNAYIFKMNDKQLDLFAKYLSRERKMNLEYFKYITDNCLNSLYIYDCSMIKNENYYINKNLDSIELHYCGQLTEKTLNTILKKQKKLKRLIITGAYLLTNFTIPKTVDYLDLTHCSRLVDKFLTQLNKTHKKINTLKLSYCYGFTTNCILKAEISNLHICETNLTFESIKSIKNTYNMKSLSIKCCPNIFAIETDEIFDFEKYCSLEYLDCEGISTLKDVNFSNHLKFLNLACCYNINIESFKNCVNLEYLNLSKVNVAFEKLRSISQFKHLKILNISWTEALTDEILLELIDACKFLEKVYVFGCFNLTTKIGELAWSSVNIIEIIGNPAETSYLLNC